MHGEDIVTVLERIFKCNMATIYVMYMTQLNYKNSYFSPNLMGDSRDHIQSVFVIHCKPTKRHAWGFIIAVLLIAEPSVYTCLTHLTFSWHKMCQYIILPVLLCLKRKNTLYHFAVKHPPPHVNELLSTLLG